MWLNVTLYFDCDAIKYMYTEIVKGKRSTWFGHNTDLY